MTILELQDKWDNISPFSNGYVLATGEHPLSFHIGYHDGERKSFVVLNTGKIEKLVSSKAITVECIQTEDMQYALRFSLNFPSLDEIFVKLCWDLIVSSQFDANPIQKLLSQYSKWIRLLEKAAPGIMSPERQKGLVGELLCFKAMLSKKPDDEVLNAWVGPDGSDQDYIFSDCWVETKAVTAAATEVSISSFQQLDRTDSGYLLVYFMDKTSSLGLHTISLVDLIHEVLGLLPLESSKDLCRCKLAKYGYMEKDADKYSEARYRFAERRIYLVEPGFPCLTASNTPPEITNARYSISLPAIETHRFYAPEDEQ